MVGPHPSAIEFGSPQRGQQLKLSGWGWWYWPFGLILCALIIIVPEVIALKNNVNDTLSVWVWRQLHIAGKYGFDHWSLSTFIAFAVWISLGVWLTAHFFFRLFGSGS